MLWTGKCIITGNIELVKANIMQEHVDTAEVVGSDVNLLPVEAIGDSFFAQHLLSFQKQGAGATGWVINLVNACLANGSQPCQKLRYISWGKELATGLACIAGIHGHEVFIGIPKGVNVMVFNGTEIHIRYAMQQLGKTLIALGYSASQLVAVHIEIIKQSGKITF